MTELVTLETRGQIALLSLNRPAQRNAISEELLAALDGLLDGLPEETRAIVLHGHGPHFCAGLDLKEHHGLGGPQSSSCACARSGIVYLIGCSTEESR